jgi:hypothetical protein
MIESELDPRDPDVEWIAREAKRPVALSTGLRARIMDAVRATPLPARPRRGLGWLVSPRPLALSPLGTSLLAAGLVGIGVLVGLAVTRGSDTLSAPAGTTVAAAPQAQASQQVVVHEFVLQAPNAAHVSLVGDFNGWNAAATPMTRTADGKWIVKVPLPAGRHVYAFEVDAAGGTKFMPDPAGLRAPDDGFGPSSVVLVGEGSAT